MFTVGDKVTWISQSKGYTTEKHGEVIAVVPAHTSPAVPNGIIGRTMFDGGKRKMDSYLVMVRIGQQKPKIYWPKPEKLERD